MDRLIVTNIYNPFDPYKSRDIRNIEYGLTVQDCIDLFPSNIGYECVVSLNGIILAPFAYPILKPKGSLVICAVPQGGGGGKDVLRVVAMLAVVVAAVTIGPEIASLFWGTEVGSTIGASIGTAYGMSGFEAASTALTAVSTMAMVAVGSAIVNAVLPPPGIDMGGVGTALANSSTYGWEVSGNKNSENITWPILYGTHRIVPPIIGKYIDIIDDKQYLHLLMAIADHEITSIDETSIRINGNKVYKEHDGVTWEIRKGTVDQQPIDGFDDAHALISINQAIPCSDPWDATMAYEIDDIVASEFNAQYYKQYKAIATQIGGIPNVNKKPKDNPTYWEALTENEWLTVDVDGDTEGLVIALGLPKGLYYANDAGTLVETNVNLDIECKKVGSSEWTVIKSVIFEELPDTLLRWQAGFYNGDGSFTWSEDGPLVSEYPDAHTEGELQSGWSEYNPETDRYEYYPSNSRWYKRQTYNYPSWNSTNTFKINDKIFYQVTGVVYRSIKDYNTNHTPTDIIWWEAVTPSIKANGNVATTPYEYFKISGCKNSPLRRVTQRQTVEFGSYQVRVRYNGGVVPNKSVRYGNDCYLEYVETTLFDSFNYAGSSLFSLRALASDVMSGGVPTIDFEATRSVVSVWNGSAYVDKDPSNPAWAAYDILHNSFYGGGVVKERIDYDAFDAWATYCTSKGFTCNIYFDSTLNLRKSLDIIGALGRAAIVQVGSEFTVFIDKEESTPAQSFIFNVANISADSLSLEYMDMTNRANAIDVTFYDKTDFYQAKTLELHAVDYDSTTEETKKTSLTLIGCVNRAEALMHGYYALNGNRYLTLTASWQADIDAIGCMPWDIVELQHDATLWGEGGRVVSSTSTAVTIDKEVTLEVGVTYTFRFQDSSTDDIYEYTLDSVSIETVTNVLEINGSFSVQPSQYDTYTLTATGSETKLVRLIKIGRRDDLTRNLVAVEYNPSIYDDSGNLEAPEFVPSVVYTTNLKAEEVQSWRGSNETRLQLSWGGFATSWNIFYKEPSSPYWVLLGTSNIPFYEVPRLDYGNTYSFCVTHTKNPGDGVTVSITLTGIVAVPQDIPAGFSASLTGQFITLSWGTSSDRTVTGYNIYLDDVLLVENVSGNKYIYRGNLTAGTYNFVLRSVSIGGISEPTNSTSITITGPTIPTVTASAVNEIATVTWNNCKQTLPIDYYTVNGSRVGNTTRFTERVNWVGSRTYTVIAYDIAGNASSSGSASIGIATLTTPTGITTSGITYAIKLALSYTTFTGFSVVEIWAAENNDRTDSTFQKVGETAALLWTHSGLNLVDRRFYWIRTKDVYGNLGSWYPTLATAGVQGDTSDSPNDYLTILQGQISEDELTSSLNSRVNWVDTEEFVLDPDIIEQNIMSGLNGAFMGLSDVQAVHLGYINDLFATTGLQGTNISSLQSEVAGLTTTDWNDTIRFAIGRYVRYDGQVWVSLHDGDGIYDPNIDKEPGVATDYWDVAEALANLVAEIDQRVDTLEGEIVTKVSSTEFNLLDNRVIAAESTIDQHSDEIALKVAQTEFDTFTEEFLPAFATDHVWEINDFVRYNELTYKCIKTSGLPFPLPSNAEYWTQEDFYASFRTALNDIVINDAGIDLTSSVLIGPVTLLEDIVEDGVTVKELSDLANIDCRISNAQVDVDGLNATVLLQASVIDSMATRVGAAEIAIDGANAAISLRATSSDIDSIVAPTYSSTSYYSLNHQVRYTVNGVKNLYRCAVAGPIINIAPDNLSYPTYWSLQDGLGVRVRSAEVNLDAVNLQYTVKLSDSYTNRVAGFGLMLGDTESEFVILSDKFKVVTPTNSIEPKEVFTVGTIDGVSTVGIAGDLIIDGTVLAAKIAADQITGDHISASSRIVAGTDNNVGVLDGSDTTWRIYAGHNTPASAPFRVDQAGNLYATSATVNGALVTSMGSSLGGNYLVEGTVTYDKISINNLSALSANMGSLTAGSIVIGTTNKLWLNDSTDGSLNIGGSTKASAPFRVTAAGDLTATSAAITGIVTANTGYIGGTDGWTIASKTLTGASDSKIAGGLVQSVPYTTSAGMQIDLTNKTITMGGSSDPSLYISADAATVLIGKATTENLYITATGVQLRNNGIVYTDLTDAVLTLGLTTAEHTIIDDDGICMYDAGTKYAQFASTINIGYTGGSHVSVDSTSVNLKYQSTAYLGLSVVDSVAAINVGATSDKHIAITSSGVALKDSSTQYGVFAATTIIGEVANSKSRIEVSNSGIAGIARDSEGSDVTRFSISSDGSGYLASSDIAWSALGVLTVGGWQIGSDYIMDTAGTTGLSTTITGGDDIRFWAGHTIPSSAPFSVTESGALTASLATITGDIVANTGKIGGADGWVIAEKTITGASDSKLISGIIESSDWGTDAGAQIHLVNKTMKFGGSSAPNFSVTANGTLSATGATISGTLTAGPDSLIGGYTISETDIYAGVGETRINFSTVTGIHLGATDFADAHFKVSLLGVVTATSGVIGGWKLDTNVLRSADVGVPRLELDQANSRMSVIAANNESKVVMGYLYSLPKHDGSGNWDVNDYGFWAATGDNLVIDGDTTYESGDWIVENDASVKINNAANNTIILLGTDAGKKGLFLYDPTIGVSLARFTSTDIFVGVSDRYLQYTTAGGLEIKGILKADTGYIGGTEGWMITANKFTDASGLTGFSSEATLADDIRIWAGNSIPSLAPFSVSESGAIIATSATIVGDISANTGYIGGTSNGWEIATGKITAVGSGLIETSAVANTGIKINSTAIAGYNGSAQTVNIATDGSGWFGLTGTRAIEWTTAGDVTIADWTINASTIVGGNVTLGISGSSGYIKVGTILDATTVATTNAGFYADNDGNILIKGNVSGSNYIKATSSGNVDINVTDFNLAATNLSLVSGAANVANLTVGTGSDAAGLNATNASTDIAIWAGSSHEDRATAPFKVTAAGYVTSTLGSIAGWSIDATKIYQDYTHLSSTGYISFGNTPPASYGDNVGAWLGYSSGAKMSLYADANNYLQWDGSKLLVKAANFSVDSEGKLSTSSASISGNIASEGLTLDATGFVKGGQTAYATGTGFFLGYSELAYKFSVGDDTKYLRWDGSALTVGGDVITTSNIQTNAITKISTSFTEASIDCLETVATRVQSCTIETTGKPVLIQGTVELRNHIAGIGFGVAGTVAIYIEDEDISGTPLAISGFIQSENSGGYDYTTITVPIFALDDAYRLPDTYTYRMVVTCMNWYENTKIVAEYRNMIAMEVKR